MSGQAKAAERKIDYDRGVIIKTHAASGMSVYMYLDQPGVYLDAYERPVSEKLAIEAGYDVQVYGKERIKRERMAQAMLAIEQELADADAQEAKIVSDIAGYKLVDIGLGRFNVVDPDDNVLNVIPLPHEQADLLRKKLLPEGSEERVAE